MTRPRQPWDIRPSKRKISVTPSFKAEVETKAQALIDNVLKPKHVLPPPAEPRFNDIIDIQAKWFRNSFYFSSIYACPGENVLSPTFESKFARIEPLGGNKFALYAMRHTGKEWIGIFDALSLDECMKAIEDDPWFEP